MSQELGKGKSPELEAGLAAPAPSELERPTRPGEDPNDWGDGGTELLF